MWNIMGFRMVFCWEPLQQFDLRIISSFGGEKLTRGNNFKNELYFSKNSTKRTSGKWASRSQTCHVYQRVGRSLKSVENRDACAGQKRKENKLVKRSPSAVMVFKSQWFDFKKRIIKRIWKTRLLQKYKNPEIIFPSRQGSKSRGKFPSILLLSSAESEVDHDVSHFEANVFPANTWNEKSRNNSVICQTWREMD